MLATGNSLLEAIKLYADKGIPIDNIKCICIIAAPQGIENIHKYYPDIEKNVQLKNFFDAYANKITDSNVENPDIGSSIKFNYF